MRTRLLIGTALVTLIVILLLVDCWLESMGSPLVSILITLLGALGWYELARITGIWPAPEAEDKDFKGLGFFLFGLVGVLYFHGIAWYTSWVGIDDISHEKAMLWGVLGSFIGGFSLVVFRHDYSRYYRAALETTLAILLLGLLFSYHIKIYLTPGGNHLKLVLIYFAGIKGTDVVAYFVGRSLGRHRFLQVSPKKTVEGCLGGIAWGAIFFAVAAATLGKGLLFPWPQGILFGIILALVAQLGDLSESLFKRVYEVKDSNALLPEFGGVLDLIDSMIFSGCLFWYLV